ncbi:hypothetical protein ACTFIY_004960 [Dictyostelium cf. discoideum]
MISDYEGPTPTKKFDQDILFDYSEGEKEFTFELLDSYISSVEEHLPELLNSFEAKDIKGAVLHSHDIKGSSSYIGCEAVRYLSGKIEAYCKNDELEKAESFYPELKKEVEEVFKILSDFKKNWDKNHGDGGSDDDGGGDDNESEPTDNNNDGGGENNNDSGKNIDENKNTDENTGKNLNDRSKSPVPLQTTVKPVTIETPKTASDKIATETPTSLANNSTNSSNNNNNNSKNENGLNSKQPQTSSNSPTKIQTK